MPGKRSREEIESRVRVTDGGCWLYTGCVSKAGYGWIRRNRKSQSAHRVFWELAHGQIPAGMELCHRCDVRQCVNPAHMFVGSHADNMRDMRAKGRASHHFLERTHCRPAGHPLTADNLHYDTDGMRECRTCWRARRDRYNEQQRNARRSA